MDFEKEQAIQMVIDSIWETYDKDNSGSLDRKEARKFIKYIFCKKSKRGVSERAFEETFTSLDMD